VGREIASQEASSSTVSHVLVVVAALVGVNPGHQDLGHEQALCLWATPTFCLVRMIFCFVFFLEGLQSGF
jgi:hypothetical protein